MDLFLSSLKPFIFIQKFYGALPYQFNSPYIKISKCVLIWGVCLCGIFSSYFAFMFYLLNLSDLPMMLHVFNIYILLISIFAVGSITSYIFHISHIRKLYEKILSYYAYLDCPDFRKKAFRVTTCEILFFHLLNSTYHIVYYTSGYEKAGDFDIDGDDHVDPEEELINIVVEIISTAAEHYLFFFITLINLQFCNSILFLKSLLNVINIELKRLLNGKKIVTVSDQERVKKDVILVDGKGSITNLVNFHDEICDLCCRLNKYFNTPLLISSVLTLTAVLLSCYFTITKLMTPGLFVCQFLYNFLNLWLILYSCESLVDETKEIGRLVHNLLAQARNDFSKDQLHYFSLQLLHRKIKFTACGLFPLDYTLIYSIAGLVTTYLVILIQFQNASGSPDGLNNNCSAISN